MRIIEGSHTASGSRTTVVHITDIGRIAIRGTRICCAELETGSIARRISGH